MTIWIDSTNQLHDDMNGAALTLPIWPQGMTQATPAQITAITNPPLTLAQSQAAQVTALQSAYQSAINTPVSFKNAAGVTSTYPAGNAVSLNGQTATDNLGNVISAGAAAWTMGHWLDTANVAQTFTFADLQGLAAAMEVVEVLDWQDLVAKVAAVQAATTVAAVQAITF